MKLVIQGLREEVWGTIREEYREDTVIEDLHTIHPCTGCFSCWNRTPGQCVIKDGYDQFGREIHHADQVVVLSEYAYGGFSGFVKNVFDRCLGYVLPQFEVIHGETHHQKRYPEDKPFTFIFYGHNLSEEEKLSARKYVRAVCANIRGFVKQVEFRELPGSASHRATAEITGSPKALLLNASVRFEKGNSAKLGNQLLQGMRKEYECVPLIRMMDHPEDLLERLCGVSDLVLLTPLYVDGLPSQLIRFMQYAEHSYAGGAKRVYVLANMGLYESRQLENLFSQVRQWCAKMGFEYCGGAGISAGELVGGLMDLFPFGTWPTKSAAKSLSALRKAIDEGEKIDELYAEPDGFPRSLYLWIANTGWNKAARRNGISPKDLYRKL